MTVVYEDEVLLVVDKPSGLPTQAARGGGPNLYDQLRAGRSYVGLHHRLDTGASGLVLLTIDPRVNGAIAAAFREHRIVRTYQALLDGCPPSGIWDRPIDGRTARTDVTVCGCRSGRSAVTLVLSTGRRHQIRIHAALAGTPVLGDRRYGAESARSFPRLALHAAALVLRHPLTGTDQTFLAALPPALSGPWAEITTRT